MTKTYTRHFSTTQTPQSEPIPGKTMVANEAGGFGFPVNDWVRLDRFLIMGTEGGSYYVTEQKLTVANAEAVLRCIQTDGLRAVARILEISEAGRASKNEPAVFALALAAKKGDDATRHAALDAVPRVCRIGTHLIQFAEAIQAFGGWGRGTKRAVGQWFMRAPEDVAYQAVKYRQREGWTLADLLRLSHPKPTATHNQLFKWIVDGELPRTTDETGEALRILEGYEAAQKTTEPKVWAELIRRHNLPREALPTDALKHLAVWEALLERMPMTAMIRNLGKMSEIGLLKPFSDAASKVVADLTRGELIKKARVHPWQVILALKTYAQGHGFRGSLTWTPVPQILDALDTAFELAFGNVTPTGKRIVLAIDASGSMAASVMGYSNFSVRQAAAALGYILVRTEPNVIAVGFDTRLVPLDLSKAQRVDDVVHAIDRVALGAATDCAIPIQWAYQQKLTVDAFTLYTDDQTWAGTIHPVQALKSYRDKQGVATKMVSSAMVATGHSVADPEDAGCLAVVGFDANAPAVIGDFLR